MDSNYGDLGQSWRMSSQAPLDSKSMVNRLSDLTDLGPGETKPFLYYRGMKVYCHEDKKTYEWTDDLNNEQVKLLNHNYRYPIGAQYDGIVYENLEFNFVEISSNYSGVSSLENVGVGVDIYNGLNEENGKSKIARLNSSTLETNKQENGSINTEINIINKGRLNDTISLYNFIPGSKVHELKKIKKSSTLIITEDEDGISFEEPNLETIKSFYVNENAPAGGDGSISRPYQTFDAAKAAFIGTGNPLQPQYQGGRIILQSDVETTEHPVINRLTLERQNDAQFIYKGSNPYPIDSELLYQALANETYAGLKLGVNGELPFDITFAITGNGKFKGKSGLRWFGANRNPLYSATTVCTITVSDSTEFEELVTDDTVFTENLQFADGSLMSSVYHTPMKATTSLLPTHPMLNFQYPNNASSATANINGKIKVNTISQSGLLLDNAATIVNENTGRLEFIFNPYRVSYKGTFGADFGVYKVYLPHDNKLMMDLKNGSILMKVEIYEPIGFAHTGWSSLFKISENFSTSSFSTNIHCLQYAKEIFLMSGNADTANVSVADSSKLNCPNVENFLRNTTSNTIYVNMENSVINVKGNVFVDTPLYELRTFGTLSSIKGKPILTGMGTTDVGILNGEIWKDVASDDTLKIK